jgi:UDP-N-acetylmuramate dehydrogenase
VLVNRGGATGGDVLALARAIQHEVRERFGVDLEPEPLVV